MMRPVHPLLLLLSLAFLTGCGQRLTVFHPATPPLDHGDLGAGEGPVWHPEGYLLFTGQGRIARWDPDGKVTVYRSRENAGSANGLLIDAQGRLVACEPGPRRVTRTDLTGAIQVLTDHYEGRKYNSPNDLATDSLGRIYFTDPRYGNRDGMEMTDAQGRLVEGVYRIDAPGRVSRILSHEVDRPNGILVTPDDQYLYVADNNNSDTLGGARCLWRFELTPAGTVIPDSRKRLFNWNGGRGPDGLEMDEAGRLYVAAGRTRARPPYELAEPFLGGVYVLSAKGNLLAFHPIYHDEVTNCAFGGEDLKTLFVTAGGHLWSLRTTLPGVVPWGQQRSP